MDHTVRFKKQEMMICARSAVNLDGVLAEVKVGTATPKREFHYLRTRMPAQSRSAFDRYGSDCQLRPSSQERHQPSRQLPVGRCIGRQIGALPVIRQLPSVPA